MLEIFSMKEESAGEVPVAFVVRSGDSNITEDEIKQFISKQVSIDSFFDYKYVPLACLEHLI